MQLRLRKGQRRSEQSEDPTLTKSADERGRVGKKMSQTLFAKPNGSM